MNSAIGPRTYLVGKILPAMIARLPHPTPDRETYFAIAESAVDLADHVLDTMAFQRGQADAE